MSPGYRDGCPGCAALSERVSHLEDELAKSAREPRWSVNIEEDHLALFGAWWLLSLVAVGAFWVFYGFTPSIIRAWCAVGLLTAVFFTVVVRRSR